MGIQTLVVDNNPVLLKAISSLLEKEGCEVQCAADGLKALDLLNDYTPDIVFTDLVMPQVSGEQLCRILRNTENLKDTFIVVVSAIVLEDQERILEETKCDICIAKGSLVEIHQYIKEALDTFYKKKKNLFSTRSTHVPEGLKPSEVTGELLFAKNQLNRVLENLGEGLLELNGQGKILFANRAALQILDCGEETLIGGFLPKAINWGPYSKKIDEWVKNELSDKKMGQFSIFENDPLDLNGKKVTASFVPAGEKDSFFGLCILRDISRQFYAEEHNKKLDNAIRLVKKMDAMSCMAGGVAHDFNNLLTIICGNLDYISLNFDKLTKEDLCSTAEQAKKAGLVAVDLTRQISCFSNFGIVSRESTEINKLIEKSLNTYQERKRLNLNYKSTEKEIYLYIDPEEIVQAISNVLTNAIEATEKSCCDIELTVDTESFVTPQLIAGQYVPPGKYCRIDFKDSGKGIEHNKIFQIFDPYYSTKERGTLKGMGLGLAVVYATLRNHGGYVVASSEVGQGTVISFFLPLLEQDQQQRQPDTPRTVKKRSVLLVDGDEQTSQIGVLMLEYLGFTVMSVADSKQAITLIENLKNEGNAGVDLIIFELFENDHQASKEACMVLGNLVEKARVIAMSGSILNPIMEDCRSYGFFTTLAKPYSIDTLKHVTNMALYY